jgi:hypothetical protein
LRITILAKSDALLLSAGFRGPGSTSDYMNSSRGDKTSSQPALMPPLGIGSLFALPPADAPSHGLSPLQPGTRQRSRDLSIQAGLFMISARKSGERRHAG